MCTTPSRAREPGGPGREPGDSRAASSVITSDPAFYTAPHGPLPARAPRSHGRSGLRADPCGLSSIADAVIPGGHEGDRTGGLADSAAVRDPARGTVIATIPLGPSKP